MANNKSQIMIEKEAKSELKMLALTAALAAVFFFGNSIVVIQAQPAPTGTGAPPGAAPEGQENVVCQAEMDKFLQVELGRFRDFIRTNFQNKSSTGSLLDTAMGRYREFRTAAYNKYYTFFPQQGAFQLTEGIEPGACLKQVDNTLALARRELETRAVQTSTVKKATALIHKYQDINNQLRVLNRTFLTMKSYLTTFADKLPCYIRKSCNKG